MKEITKIFTHKYGPLKLWAWLGIGAVGLVAYRRKQAGQSLLPTPNTGGDTGLGSNQTSPNTPPDLYYEPGGSLPVTVGGGTNSTGGSGIGGLLTILEKLISQRNRRPKRKHHHHHKPPVKHHKPGDKHRHRSHTHVHNQGGRHRHFTHGNDPQFGKQVNPGYRNQKGATKGAKRDRKSLAVGAIKGRTIRQRPVAATQPSHHPAPRPAPRPSAPKQRTMRAPRKK